MEILIGYIIVSLVSLGLIIYLDNRKYSGKIFIIDDEQYLLIHYVMSQDSYNKKWVEAVVIKNLYTNKILCMPTDNFYKRAITLEKYNKKK